MEYALPSHNFHTTAELNGGDFFSMPLQQAHDISGAQQAAAHSFPSEGNAPSESQINQVVAGFNAQQKASQISQPMITQNGAKVKRQDDIWTGKIAKSIGQLKSD